MGNIFKSIVKGIGGAFSGAAKSIPIVGQAVDGLVGSLSSASDARASLRAQNQLLQKQQQFAHDEAELNRQFQREMFDTTNAYNSPKAQVARMVEAGLNPALMYGSGAGSIAAQSPSGSMASAPSAPTPQGLSDLSLRAAEIARVNAETAAIKSQTKKTDAETGILSSDASFRNALNAAKLEMTYANINLSRSVENLNDNQVKVLRQQCKKIDSECQVLDSTIDEIKAKIANLGADTYLKRLHGFLDSSIAKAQIQKMASETSMNYANARAIVEKLSYEIANLQANTKLLEETGRKVMYEGDRLSLDYEVDLGGAKDSFRYMERLFTSASSEVGALTSVLRMFYDSLK